MNPKKSKFISYLQKHWPFLVYFFVSIIFLFPILMQSGLPFKYDWWWPIFDMKQFWTGLTDASLQGIFSSLSKTGPAIFGLFGLVHFPSDIFFKLFIFFVHFTAGYGFYRFIRNRVKSETVAVVSGLVYAFTPYIFIRTIVGFTWSMVAYAVLPIFLSKYWQTKKSVLDFLIIGFLLSLIFGQTQAGILTVLIITVHLVIASHWVLPRRGNPSTSLRTGLSMLDCHVANHTPRNDRKKLLVLVLRNFFFTFISLFIFALPWAIVMLFKQQSITTASGGAVTTLNFIASLPHSFRNIFMLSDHHITAGYFYPLSHDRYYLLGWLVVWLIALCAIFNKKNINLVLTFSISSVLVLPFIKGPTGIFSNFYIWFYARVPQIAVFRETYHFEFLYAISLCVLFALGLDWIWQKVDEFRIGSRISSLQSGMTVAKLASLLLASLKAILTTSAIVIIWPYLTFNYASYLKLQKIPPEYTDLHNYFQNNKNACHRIYYPPGLGFVYFNSDNSPGASNSDLVASSLSVPYLTDGTSVLNIPSDEMFYRNELASHFYDQTDRGQFTSLLNDDSIDCVVVRMDMGTKYKDASNLGKETDPVIISKWENDDWLGLIRSKQGLRLEKQFGEDIYIFKSNNQDTRDNNQTNSNVQNLKIKETGMPAIQQFSQTPNPKSQILPLTEWATEFAYYRDGWSRGRYDFWRKSIFTQLRQDFIYTDKSGSVLNGKIAQTGSYDLWVRFLTGGSIGTWDLGLGGSKFQIQKDSGEEKFIWKKLGAIHVEKGDAVSIRSISGENAVADLVLVEPN